jgi:hypothetical protein
MVTRRILLSRIRPLDEVIAPQRHQRTHFFAGDPNSATKAYSVSAWMPISRQAP